jgi:hypothetical protein
MNLTLHYLAPGKRQPVIRAKRKVSSIKEALEFMKANPDTAFFPASVTRGWGVTVAILG